MATQSQDSKDEQMLETAAENKETTMSPTVLAAGFSLVLSLYYFFVQGDKTRGIFVGLWPPTIFAFVDYFKTSAKDQEMQ